ncbi:Putative 3-methyladenine DNA glycosylase [Dyadobacter sp. CECT 9275]|uniref:Putative 3-methyladenine DNA glycosylase n=1 Tax=Dyadobacter helix TaxID=2822344 RepID=A0A916JIM1_9BACT|nr:DNA-3-methyladenine glycosylase [Dyadobacter sp. CECT 9275]CAG5016552.1 Putative 3-methyladenine DNA glycosylase [Dyadobacter sp. CECT 9275]
MTDERLPLSFYQSFDTTTLAKKLLGCELVHNSPDGISSGIIVETEAYLQDDPACHAYNRRTPRTEPMYGEPGTAYVYLIYGMYECINVVSNRAGIGEAVLIRALQPLKGAELMAARRALFQKKSPSKPIPLKYLCNGPGKLVVAMGISRYLHNTESLCSDNLYISSPVITNPGIETSARIGITKGVDLPYRYFIKDNIYVSK